MHESYNDMILAETSKIVLPSRRNATFQEIEDPPKLINQQKIDEKLSVFWDIDFGRIPLSPPQGGGHRRLPVCVHEFVDLIFGGLWTAFWGTFVDRVGAPERAQINIHDHWLRMLIGGRGIMGSRV